MNASIAITGLAFAGRREANHHARIWRCLLVLLWRGTSPRMTGIQGSVK